MRIFYTILPLLWLDYTASAQAITQALASRYLNVFALSGKQADVLAARNNPAAHAALPQSSVGVYAERRFMLQDLSLFQASGGVNTPSGNFGLHAGYFGHTLQNQLQLSLAYGRKISKVLQAGAAFHYQSLRQSGGYGNASAITGSFGLLMQLNEQIQAGISAYNPFRTKWGNAEGEKLPSRYSFGIGMDVSDGFFLGADLVKEENLPIDVQVAMHYSFLPQYFMRAGISTGSSNYFVGVGFKLPAFRIDLSTSYHPQLGWTPGILLLTNLGKVPAANE